MSKRVVVERPNLPPQILAVCEEQPPAMLTICHGKFPDGTPLLEHLGLVSAHRSYYAYKPITLPGGSFAPGQE